MTTLAQTRMIQTLKRQTPGMEDADYRDKLRRDFGVASSSQLSVDQAKRLIDDLKRLSGAARAPAAARKPGARAEAPILQALWISLYNLGAVASRDDRALIEFVRRQTSREHPRFLTPVETSRTVEALKAWAAREGVDWTEDAEPKRCVARAIVRKLVAKGLFTPFMPGADPWPGDVERYGYGRGLPAAFGAYRPEHWDDLSAALGKRLRAGGRK